MWGDARWVTHSGNSRGQRQKPHSWTAGIWRGRGRGEGERKWEVGNLEKHASHPSVQAIRAQQHNGSSSPCLLPNTLPIFRFRGKTSEAPSSATSKDTVPGSPLGLTDLVCHWRSGRRTVVPRAPSERWIVSVGSGDMWPAMNSVST